MNITIRPCLRSELEILRAISYETFDETFRKMNTPETIDRYLEEAFNPEKILSEWSNLDSQFYFMYVDADLAGYLKVNDAPAQSDIHDPESLEIERIYIRKAYKRKGLGAQFMTHALQLAVDMGKRYAWLGVWEKNTAAIAFYQKLGFQKIGRHTFKMGDELQYDWIMKKELAG